MFRFIVKVEVKDFVGTYKNNINITNTVGKDNLIMTIKVQRA